ncbi:MAG: flagellar basal-body rod protein FlgG [Armatimonadetes bacterium]|nr:flagellar basal-body rod protein FlgG [Armatimonadota bacterium]
MMRALNTAATGMVAQQYNLDTIANNLANVNTTAFKGNRAEFQDLMYQTFRASGVNTGATSVSPVATQIGLGTMFTASVSNFAMGPLQSTGNATDLAINGPGFFQVQRPDGNIYYTRDGSFKRDASGLLVTSDGYPLVPSITIPAGARAIDISETGIVSAILPDSNDPQQLGTIELTTFPNPTGLTKIGQNLFARGGSSGDPTNGVPGTAGIGTLRSTFLEGSNVQVVEEMVKMITAQRAYEINSKAIQTSDDMLGTLNQLKR